jgi:hypothetical protein
VRTTIDAKVGRRGGAYSVEELENTLNQARRLLDDVIALTDLEKERLLEQQSDEDGKRLAKLTDLVSTTQKAMQTIIMIEQKYGLSAFEARQQLDLEAARAEILERIRRIAGKVTRRKEACAA